MDLDISIDIIIDIDKDIGIDRESGRHKDTKESQKREERTRAYSKHEWNEDLSLNYLPWPL